VDSEQQQLFKTELLKIQNNYVQSPLSKKKSGIVLKNALPLQNFKNSKVFQTLLRRQSNVVSRINQIKLSFS